MAEERTTKSVAPFHMFMDALAKADKSNRNKLITDELALINSDEQVKLVNELRSRGINYIPSENRRFYEV
jgi:hypothetical protein